jgi:2-dehydro-3-deoxygalactonokinase
VAERTEWVAVDWGTSNLRAWGIGARGERAFFATSDKGMGRLATDAFPGALDELLSGYLVKDGGVVDILICGMAGARQGWREAPYLDAPAELGRLAAMAVEPPMPRGSRLRPRILPGVCQRMAGSEDVMRGEETQLLGVSAVIGGFAGLVVMPGTHSKWAQLDGTRVTGFTTGMTGELFELLKTHSVLRHSLGGEASGPDHSTGFDAGLDAGLARPGRLTSALFGIRPRSLLSGAGPSWCSGYLSGLLIGAEIGGHKELALDGKVPLVGGAALCGLYARGFAKIEVETTIIDATDATLAGLKAARAQG